MIPSLKVLKTLGIELPIKAEGVLAAMPILAFKVFVVYGVIASFKVWYKIKNESDKSAQKVGSRN